MALTPWRPLSTFTRWPDLWDSDSDVGTYFDQPTSNLDLYETEDTIIVEANVAGVEPKDIDLTFEQGILWIKAQRQTEEQEEEKQHYQSTSWSYSYKVRIPGKLDIDQEPEAEVHNGVLTVSFAKSKASKPRKLKVRSRE